MENRKETYKLILTSRGLNTLFGCKLLAKVLHKEKLQPTSIFLISLPRYEIDELLLNACLEIGYEKENIYFSKDYESADINEFPQVDMVYVTEGNTFEVIDYMRRNRFDIYAKEHTLKGGCYMGSSAGAILASYDFRQAEYFDSNYMRIYDYRGLGLMIDTEMILPHYDYRQLQRYIAESGQEVAHYSKIYNCANEEAVIMSIGVEDDTRRVVSVRRVRGE